MLGFMGSTFVKETVEKRDILRPALPPVLSLLGLFLLCNFTSHDLFFILFVHRLTFKPQR